MVSVFAGGSNEAFACGLPRSRSAAAGAAPLCFCNQGIATVPTAASTPAAHRITAAYTAACSHLGETRRRLKSVAAIRSALRARCRRPASGAFIGSWRAASMSLLVAAHWD
jgi:hypothetical protein